MKEIRDKKGKLTGLVLNKTEWNDMNKFDKEAAKKRDNYIKEIKEKYQFTKLENGNILVNVK